MPADCLFCKIISGAIPSAKVFEDESCFAFKDIAPKAPLHVLFVPKEHFSGALEITEQREAAVGHLARMAAAYAQAQGIAEGGFRLVLNTNPDAGQTVFHLHLHLLGGQQLGGMA